MPYALSTICGGLPVVVDLDFIRGDGYTSDDDIVVNGIYWQTKKSHLNPEKYHGKEIPEKLRDRAEKMDYMLCKLTEEASDWLAYRDEPPEQDDSFQFR